MKLKIMLLAMVILGTAAAQAQVVVSENGTAGRDCFLHARFGYSPAEGLKTCTIALSQGLTARNRAATYDNRGIILNRQGRIDEAAADFDRAIALQPDLGDAYINSGAVMIMKKSYEDALAQINKGLALNVSYPEIGYYNRALALEQLGRYREAYYDYKKALELEPNLTQATERLTHFVVNQSPGQTPAPSPVSPPR